MPYDCRSKTQRRYRGMYALMILLASVPAHAYLDPGAGSAIIQGFIAAIAALGVALRLYWHRIASVVGRRKREKPGAASESDDVLGDRP